MEEELVLRMRGPGAWPTGAKGVRKIRSGCQ